MKSNRKPLARRAVITALSALAISAAGIGVNVGVAGAAPKSDDTTTAQQDAHGTPRDPQGTPQNTQGESQSSSHSNSHADHSTGNAGTSGDPSQPQPPSNADQNPGGANGDQCSTDPKGTYCSTRDGSPSGNGNGNGQATGKPCAGCVGKADNKNPPGQEKADPFNTFPNNGYECDRNHGIGRTNPAHTGCTATTPPPECDEATEDCGPPECDEATEDCGPPECDEATEDCGPPECDEATEDCGPTTQPECVPTTANNNCTGVLGNHHTRKPPTVLGERAVRTPTAEALPFTGADIVRFVPIGIAVLMVGGLCTAIGRRRRMI